MGSLDMLGMTEINGIPRHARDDANNHGIPRHTRNDAKSMGSLDTLGDALAVRWMSENNVMTVQTAKKTRHMPIQHMPLFFCVYIGLFLCVPVFLEKEAGRLPSGTRSDFGSRAVHIKRFHLIVHMYTQIQRLA